MFLQNGEQVRIRHLLIEGSSQWVVGRNVTSKCDIQHINGNFLKLPNGNKVSLIEKDMHSYISYQLFVTPEINLNDRCLSSFYFPTATVQGLSIDKPWS